MRLSNGFVIDKEKTFGELKFTAVRDVFLQNEDGTPSTQSIVGYNITAGMHLLQNHFIIFYIETLVPIHKCQVEHDVHAGHNFKGITDIKLDFIGIG